MSISIKLEGSHCHWIGLREFPQEPRSFLRQPPFSPPPALRSVSSPGTSEGGRDVQSAAERRTEPRRDPDVLCVSATAGPVKNGCQNCNVSRR